MSLPTDTVSDPVIPPRDPAILARREQGIPDEHREINSRRAELENPELLRRIRSL